MAGLESRNANTPTVEIPGLKGIEKLNTIPALKSGSFREFLNKVAETKKDQKQAHDEIKKIDDDKTLSSNEKKTQLRAIDRSKLFAVIAKNIEFGETGIEITLDFGDLTFAEKKAIGAGDILPPSVRKVAFGKDESEDKSIGSRSIGPNGREYRSKNNKYMASSTNTKLFISYSDIMDASTAQAAKMDEAEKKSGKKAEGAVADAKQQAKDLRQDIDKGRSAPAPRETREVGVSHQPVFIGDSQMEGMGNYYLRRHGVDVIDLRSMRMESIARTLKDPSKINEYYGKKSEKFVTSRKEHLLSGREKLRTTDAIVLQCGGNNIAQHHSLEKMQSSLEKLVSTIRTFNQTAPLYVGMLMIHEDTPQNAVSRQYNAWLLEQASKGAFHVINSDKIVKESGIKRPKGAHLDRDNYVNLAKQALKAINYNVAKGNEPLEKRG